MARIKQLPPHEVHKIAAGEVVERPANVVKELVENALDAGATHITMFIEQAGKKLIRVVDNGSGMDREDAYHCFDHHATSKITSINDLPTLKTYGFRGEALSSIAAVSHVTLITKEHAATEGIKLVLEGKQLKEETTVSCNTGTDLNIAHLFYNVPARKKFLRADDTEWRQITTLFQAFCFAYPHVHFILIHDSKLIYNCPPTKELMIRIAQLWDETVTQHMIALENHETIKGAISHHHYARYDRSSIFLFVNHRWIKNQHLAKALLKGYLQVLPPARFPAAVLFVEVPAGEVDINIHPRKEEVQFLHPRIIETQLQKLITTTLEAHLSSRLQKSIPVTTPSQPIHKPTFDAYRPLMETFAHQQSSPSANIPTSTTMTPSLESPPHVRFTQKSAYSAPTKALPVMDLYTLSNHSPDLEAQAIDYVIVGQVNQTYLLIDQPEGLFLIDQHAAHERILYAQFEHRFKEIVTAPLLFPHLITMTSDDLNLLLVHLELLEQHGLIIEQVSPTELMVKGAPPLFSSLSFEELLKMVIGWFHESKTLEPEALQAALTHNLRAQMACKAAVKAGDILSKLTMEQLITDLNKTTNRFSCPHGRPTGWLFSWYEIEKKFKRKL
jgi:DNA mismatch repair protein MutL